MTRSRPPRIAQWLLARTLPDGVRGASIRGDLLEEFAERNTRETRGMARRWYWTQALAIAGRAVFRRSPGAAGSGQAIRRASLRDALTIDLKYAVRSLLRARGFTVMAVITLALGIGASTAVFSVVNAILVRPLSFSHPEQVMWVTEVGDTGSSMSVSWPDYVDWRARQTSFEDIAAVRPVFLNLTGPGEPERLAGRWVTWNFLSVLGVQAARGRTFTESEDRPGAPFVALISDGFWRRRFNADPNVLGRTIMLDGDLHKIIGVLPAQFRYNPLTDDQMYVSMGQRVHEGGLADRGNHDALSVVGRLRAGVNETRAREDLKTIAAALTREYPDTNADVRTQLMPVTQRFVGDVAPTLKTLLGAVGFLLLLGAVNVANLLVARSLSRQHELAVRAALGCGRWRQVRQLLVESGVLALTGGVCGLLVSAALIRMLIAAAPPDLPRLDEVRLDGIVVAFALGVSTISALLLGAFPAISSSGVRGGQVVVRTGRGDTTTVSAHRIRRGLMVAEVALAVVLLTGAGLMVRTVRALTTVDPGFESTNLLTMRFSIDGEPSTPALEAAFDRRLNLLYDDVLRRLQAVPGVERAAFTLSLPIEGSQWGSIFIVDDRPVPPRAQLPTAAFIPVTAGYFETMKMTLRAGRFLDPSDVPGAPEAIVVNEVLAHRFWPGGTAIGRQLKQSWPEDPTPWRTIVGVVGDVKLDGVEQVTPMQVYMAMRQHPSSSVSLVVRAASSPDSLTKPIAAVIHEADRNIPLYRVQSMEALMTAAVSRQRLTMIILGGFAAIALVLAFVGLYGVISHGVLERTREIGVRLALGATRTQVIRLFVGQGIMMTALGLVIGGALALAVARLAEGLLFNVKPTDPAAIWAALGLLSAVAIGACYVPARRASRVDPTVALRGE